MILYDAQLGWKLKPYWSGKHHHYDYDVSYTINKDGFRGETAFNNTGGYAVVGDSFSFGLGVNDDETFTSLLNNNSDKTFYNFSVPGYSTDQQTLLLDKMHSAVDRNVLLVVYLGNDVFDNMRAYPLQADHGKPYYKLVDDKLVLKNTPVPLAQKSAAARKETISSIVLGSDLQVTGPPNWLSKLELNRRLGLFQTSPVLTKENMQSRFIESLELMLALLSEVEKIVANNNGKLNIVLLPGRSYVEQAGSVSAQYQEYFLNYIASSIQPSSTLDVIDLATDLRELHNTGVNNLYYPNEGHLTARGHQYVADFLLAQLQ